MRWRQTPLTARIVVVKIVTVRVGSVLQVQYTYYHGNFGGKVRRKKMLGERVYLQNSPFSL
jgi:hypothetical protein